LPQHETVTAGSEAANRARLDSLLDRKWLLVADGVTRPAESGRTYADISPVTETEIAQAPDAGPEDADRAVSAAVEAGRGWAALPARRRADLLIELADAVDDRALDFALLDAVDCGAPVTEMLSDVRTASTTLRMFAGLGLELKGTTVPASDNLHYTVREPFGVALRIAAFNHPFMFAAAKAAAPLMAGNATVLKPSEVAPLSSLLFGELANEILPPGVLSVLVGNSPELPRAIVRDPRVPRIALIGSVATGQAIQRDAAEVGVKDVTLELGGKNALIAYPDADPLEVADAAVAGMNFTWSGQSCGSTSRLFVHESIADEVVDQVVKIVESRTIASPLSPDSQQGTMASRAQFEKVLRYVEIGRGEGARLLTGGDRPSHLSTGLYIRPAVFDHVDPSSRLATEEIFGPVLSVCRWSDEESMLQAVNAVEYGLTAAIWTNDVRRAHRVARRVEAGFVWINGVSRHFAGVPFGGVKASGLGREEGLDELLSYTTVKSVNVML
jgi:acyl-CoA reductase-like NAD-dependent aldehyde dehydrogenase